MARRQGRDTPPFSLRLTRDERARLDAEADGLPLGSLIRFRLFDTPSPRRRQSRYRDANRQLILQVLAELGKGRLSSNLNQIAKAIHNGALVVTPEVAEQVREARADLQEIKLLLKTALDAPPEAGGGDKP